MTASADKVQYILQGSLQQTLPLVKKGIFTEQQLRQIMLQRQKNQNKLYSSTYKLSHFLKSIQFQYDLERQRLYKIKHSEQNGNINPLYRKQGKTDFSIVKRIIKLWDRTMHKYRFRTYLWKQYLSFCITIKSKKHFYKALTNALRFLPFELQLWKIGVRYEVEIGRNLWKARKLFHKGLKLVPSGNKNILLTKQLIKFELQFVQMLQQREKIIKGQQDQGKNDMKFIMGDKQRQMDQEQSQEQNEGLIPNMGGSQLLKLRQYHQVLYIALVDSISKNYKSKTYFHNRQHLSGQQRCQILCGIYQDFIQELIENEQNELLIHILKVTQQKLTNYKNELSGIKLQQKQDQDQNKMEVEQQDMGLQVQEDVEEDNQYDDHNQQINNNNNQQDQQQQNQLQIEEQIQVITKEHNKQLSKQQKYVNQILQNYGKTNKLDDKLLIKAIKQFCLKPNLLINLLQPLLPHFFTQILNILIKNQWLRLPMKILQQILSKLNSSDKQTQSNKQLNPILLNAYITKQLNKMNTTQYITSSSLLRQVIILNKNNNKIEQNNKLYRSILVNCKQNIQFIQRAKILFTSL